MKRGHLHLYGMTCLTDMTGFLVVFAVSRALGEAGAGTLEMGLVGGANALAFGASSMLGGRVVDRVGRRRMISGGIGVMFLGALGCLLLEAPQAGYFASYALVGIGPGMIFPGLIAWITQSGAGSVGRTGLSRSLILFCISWNLGIFSGQVSGGWLFRLDASAPLYLAMALCGANLALLWDTRRHGAVPYEDQVEPTPDIEQRRQLSAAFVRLAWLANLGGTFSMGMVFHLLPRLIVSLGIESSWHGIMLAAMRVIAVGVYILMYRTRFWHHRFSTALGAQAVAMGGMLVVATANSGAVLMLGLAGVALLSGYNYFASLYYSTSGSADESRSASSGMHEATLALGLGAGSVCGGLVGGPLGDRAPYLLAAGAIAALAVVQTVLFLRQRSAGRAAVGAEAEVAER